MHNFLAVCFLTVSFFFVVCVSANGKVTQGDATTAVEQAKVSVMEVRNKAKNQLDNAQSLLQRVESFKDKAEDAKVKSQKAPKDNTDAVAIASTIKSLSEKVNELYATEKPKLDTAVNTLTALLSEAETLNGKTDITIEPDAASPEDYTETNEKAAALKLEATKLNGQIDTAIAPVSQAGAKAEEMETKTKQAQLKDAHVSVIVAVATIHTILGKADTTIGQIEEKKNEVSGIVDEMQTLKTNSPTVSNKNIEALHTNAANALTSAKGATQNIKDAKADIQTQQRLADAALTKVKAENQEVSDAQGEVKKAEECVTAAQLIFQKLNNALETATISLTSATDLLQKLKTALSTTTTAPITEEVKETEKANPPEGNGTEPDQKDTTTQPTITDTIQPASKDSHNQEDSSVDKLKDALSKGAQTVPTTALTGGKAPAPGAKNDSAMTVSVPLLVALIAFALWQ